MLKEKKSYKLSNEYELTLWITYQRNGYPLNCRFFFFRTWYPFFLLTDKENVCINMCVDFNYNK